MYISRERLVIAALCIFAASIVGPAGACGAGLFLPAALETEVAALSAFAAEFFESGYKLGSTGVEPARFLPLANDWVAAIIALLPPSSV